MSRYNSVSIDALKSDHQHRVEMFMRKADLPVGIPLAMSVERRILLAKLAMEEVLEYINDGLGVAVTATNPSNYINMRNLELEPVEGAYFNPVEIIDGVCDIRYTTTLALSILGIPDEPFQEMVDINNLMKFSAGKNFNEYGKLIKPANHPIPEIKRLYDSISG